jgi:predicted double-glycine peptidase
MIELPDIRQKFDWDCGQTCCNIVWRYYRSKRLEIPTTGIDGADPRTIESVLRMSGLCVISGELDYDDLRHFTRLKRPVITLVQASESQPSGHYVVVCGATRNRVCYQDPLCGHVSQHYTAFKERWHDVDRLGTVYRCWGLAVA